MTQILAVDGGGTKTILAMASQGGEIYTWLEGAGINPVDNADWRSNLADLFGAAGSGKASAALGVLALPSFGEAEPVSALQQRTVAALLDCPHVLLNDVDAAHAGAFAGGPGVLILAGTGSMAWGRNEQGHSIRVGGWGEAFGDEGSAYWIGREALACVSKAIDGRLEASGLMDRVFSVLDLDIRSPLDSLLRWHIGLSHPRSQIAALAAVVDDLADKGEPTATDLLHTAADHLALHVEAAWQRLRQPAPGRWSYAGGVFASRHILARLRERLGRQPDIPRLPPIGGALLRAARDLDWPVDEAWIQRLGASIAERAAHARNGLN